jgi:hypothetical protein
LGNPSRNPEIMRYISGVITTKPGEIFVLIPILADSETLTLYASEEANKVVTPLEKGIHLVLENVSFSMSDCVDFLLLPFAL